MAPTYEQTDTQAWADQSIFNSVLLQYFTIVSYVLGSGNNSKCFSGLGCLEISEKWYDLSRPINLLPLDREVVNTQFLLLTTDRITHRLDVEDAPGIRAAGYEGSKPTKVIIHGFIDTGQEPWVQEMADALLAVEDCNVIAVAWGGGSLPLYSQAAANTRLVGLEVAHLVGALVAAHGADPGQVHIIGHSLGAHVAGYAGERIPGLGRISGLDPAEPLFQGMPAFVRLDPTDAEFVDVIHTDSESILMGGYGMEQPVGHVDFYPNGGDVQPGCSLLELPSISSITVEALTLPSADTVGRHLVACAHNRAIDLYIDSIRSQRSCPMVGHRCSSYAEFKSGSCYHCGTAGEACAVLGHGARRHAAWEAGPVRMYLDTGPMAPYCSHHYLLEVVLAQPRQAEAWVQGYLKVHLFGDYADLREYDLTPDPRLLHQGSTLTFLLSSPHPLGSSAQAGLQFDGSFSWSCTSCNARIAVARLVLRSLDKSEGVAESSLSLCGEERKGLGYSDIRSGSWKLFYKKACPHS